jgi:hypothetical protein
LSSRPGLMCTAGHILLPGAELISAKPVRFSAWQNWSSPGRSQWERAGDVCGGSWALAG